MAQPTKERFGRYELVSKLGRGGMAETWRARLLGAAGVTKPVLIKKVLAEYANDDSFVAMFISEAHISATLSHGNIAQVFDFGRVDGDFFLAMEFVDGQPLNRVMKRALKSGLSGIPVPTAAFIVLEMCRGLHYAHTRRDDKGAPLGIVHRDISPDNVLLSYEGQVKIVDFGIAKARALRGFQTEPGVVKGKYLFFSPEQARGKEVDARTDVWASGVVLYELLCGQLPVSGPSYTALPKLVAGEFPSPRDLRPELPEELDDIVMRALAVDPARRFESSHAFGDALAGFLYSSAPRFSSMSVAYLLQELFRADLEAEGREVHVPRSFIEELSLWRSGGTGQTPEEPLAAPTQRRWLVPAVIAGSGLLAGLLFAALGSEPSSAPAPGALQPLPLGAASKATASPRPEAPSRQPPAVTSPPAAPATPPTDSPSAPQARGIAVYPVDSIFLEARRDIIPVPSSGTGLQLDPNKGYRVSEPSVPEGLPPLFFWLKSPVAGAKGLEGMLSRKPMMVVGGTEAIFFGLEPMDRGPERWVQVEDVSTRERSTVLLDKGNHASVERAFELEGLEETATYRLLLDPRNNWARTRGSAADVVGAVVCLGRSSGKGAARSSAFFIPAGTTTEVRGVSTLLCGFLDDDPSDNQGQARMSITLVPTPLNALGKQVTGEARDLYSAGTAFLRQGQHREAQAAFRKCMTVDPAYAECYLMLGTTEVRLNRREEGARYYRDFLELAPNHPNAPKVRRLVEDYDRSRRPGGQTR